MKVWEWMKISASEFWSRWYNNRNKCVVCGRKTKAGYTLCQWHKGAFHRAEKKLFGDCSQKKSVRSYI